MKDRELELLPCPFCGDPAEADYDELPGSVVVGCSTDNCVLGNVAMTPGWWNTRYDAGRSQWVALRSEADFPKESGKSYYWTGKNGTVSEFAYFSRERGMKREILRDYVAWMPVPDKPAPYRTPEDKQS